MKNLFYNLLYLIDVSAEVLLMKALSLYYGIDNYIFLGFVFSWFLPYFLYKIVVSYKNPNWYDLINGLLDFFILQLISVAVSKLSIGEYISYRTSTTIFTAIILYFLDRKILSINKYIGLFFILAGCISLLSNSGFSSIVGTLVCLLASLFFSVSNVIIEKKVINEEEKKLNFYWSKLISSIMNLSVAIITQINYNLIGQIMNTNNLFIVILLCFFISLTENIYCYLKIKIISENTSNNGSLIINYLDIIRRFIMIFVSIFIFSEKYENYLYISFTVIIIGVLINIIDYKKLREYIIKKFYNRIPDNHDVELTIV
jgi:drug/metabolite transporter (DMT)-like permease